MEATGTLAAASAALPAASPAPRAQTATAIIAAVATPDDALLIDEARRVRSLSLFAGLLALLVIFGVGVVGGDGTARLVHRLGLVATLGVCVYVRGALRSLDAYRPWHGVLLGHGCAIGTGTAFLYWGPFSAALVVVPASVLILAPGRHFAGVVSVAAVMLALHMAVALGMVAGWLPDTSINAIDPGGDRTLAAQLVRIAQIQAIIAATFILARRARRSARSSIEQLDSALRALGQRDALLAEAHRERAELLRAGEPGRYAGEVIGGYRLDAVIGRGANGVVYEGVHVATGEQAAIKLLHAHVLAHPEQFRRFARELRIAAELRSPHLVRVLELPSSHAELPFMAMERLYGESLSDYLVHTPVMPVDDVVDMLRQVGMGLQAAHRADIVHRDLKPRNVYRLDPPVRGVRWKILDFGICKHVEHDITLTELGKVVGTPAYMAPEQARGARVDYRADLYALGVLAYRALTGRPPFAHRELAGLVHDVVYTMPPQPSRLQPLHADVDRVLAIALAKHPYERFAAAAELVDALAAAARGELEPELRHRADALIAQRPWSMAPVCPVDLADRGPQL